MFAVREKSRLSAGWGETAVSKRRHWLRKETTVDQTLIRGLANAFRVFVSGLPRSRGRASGANQLRTGVSPPFVLHSWLCERREKERRPYAGATSRPTALERRHFMT